MQTSKTDLIDISEINLDNIDDNQHNHSQKQTQDINQFACCLKNALFSKYISNYLIKKTEQMWILYEKRIDEYFKEKHVDLTCHHDRPHTVIQLEKIANDQQEKIATYQHELKILCSSRKKLGNENKYLRQTPSTHYSSTTQMSNHVPKTPRCIDRYENHINELDNFQENN